MTMLRNSKGFSLVELMIVVAIIGILAAIAIPNFVAMQLKAKRAELPSNVSAIKTAELAYDAAFDTYLAAGPNPATVSGKAPQAWGTSAAFNSLGWKPDGEVRGSYEASVTSATDFLVVGLIDVDGDGVNAEYNATLDENTSQITTNDVY